MTTPAYAVSAAQRAEFFSFVEDYGNFKMEDDGLRGLHEEMYNTGLTIGTHYQIESTPMFVDAARWIGSTKPEAMDVFARLLGFSQMIHTGLSPATFRLTLDMLINFGAAEYDHEAATHLFLCYLFFPNQLRKLNPPQQWKKLAYEDRSQRAVGAAGRGEVIRRFEAWDKIEVSRRVRQGLLTWSEKRGWPMTMFFDAKSPFWTRFWNFKTARRMSAWHMAMGYGPEIASEHDAGFLVEAFRVM